MTVPAAATADPGLDRPPRARDRRRAAAAWTGIVTGIVVVAVAMTMISGIAQLPARGLLDPDAAGPEGSRALARILQQPGIEVVVVRDRDAARSALAGADATLAWGDTSPLSDDTILDLSSTAVDVVLLTPHARDLRLLLSGATTAGYGSDAVTAQCELPEAQRSGAISPGALFTAGTDTLACYGVAGDGYGLLVREAPDGSGGRQQRVSAVDATVLFTNEHLADAGNAALAAGLLGRHSRLVWYLPALTDSDFADATPALGDLTPPWVTPVMLLLLLSVIAAAVWRGRRLGEVVAEQLPVTVRAGETTEGRARLYARAGDPTHAADRLRIATLRRAARLLSLGPAASASEISDAVAARVAADRAATRELLLDGTVDTDRDLVVIADRLRSLEERLHRSLRPGRNVHD